MMEKYCPLILFIFSLSNGKHYFVKTKYDKELSDGDNIIINIEEDYDHMGKHNEYSKWKSNSKTMPINSTLGAGPIKGKGCR